MVNTVAFIRILDRVYETEFSKFWHSNAATNSIVEWLPESEFQGLWGKRSPSYGFLGVFHWQETLMSAFDAAKFDQGAQLLVASNFVTHLKHEDPTAARRYALEVSAYATRRQGQAIHVTNSPAWLASGVFAD